MRTRPLTLTFTDAKLETSYQNSTLSRELLQGRTAIVIGSIIYLLYGILDIWFVPAEHRSTVWIIRLSALLVPFIVFPLTWSAAFPRWRHLALASVGLAAGLGLIAKLFYLSEAGAAYFYPGLVLVTFYTYNFIGTRFIYALLVDLALLITYNLLIGIGRDYALPTLVSHDFFIISANLIGGAAGYLHEKQKRLLYLRERELDRERNRHLYRALHDPLTQLPNRELLFDRIEQSMQLASRSGQQNAGIFIDLDGFKAVNDMHGHDTGDLLLCQIAERLRDAVRQSDTVARLGGDEFFIVAHHISSDQEAHALGAKLIALIEAPITGIASKHPISASIGICRFPYPEMSSSDIIRRADQAMYAAKRGGKGHCVLAAAAQ